MFFKADFWIDFSACVQGVEVSNSVCTGCKFFYNCNTRTTQRNYKYQLQRFHMTISSKIVLHFLKPSSHRYRWAAKFQIIFDQNWGHKSLMTRASISFQLALCIALRLLETHNTMSARLTSHLNPFESTLNCVLSKHIDFQIKLSQNHKDVIHVNHLHRNLGRTCLSEICFSRLLFLISSKLINCLLFLINS